MLLIGLIIGLVVGGAAGCLFMQQKSQNTIQQLKTQKQSLERDYKNQLREKEKEHEFRLREATQTLRSDYEKQSQEIENRLQSELNTAHERHQAELSALQEELQQRHQSQLQENETRLKAEYEAQIQTLTQQYAEQLQASENRLKAEYETQIQTLTGQLHTAERLKAEYETRLQTLAQRINELTAISTETQNSSSVAPSTAAEQEQSDVVADSGFHSSELPLSDDLEVILTQDGSAAASQEAGETEDDEVPFLLIGEDELEQGEQNLSQEQLDELDSILGATADTDDEVSTQQAAEVNAAQDGDLMQLLNELNNIFPDEDEDSDSASDEDLFFDLDSQQEADAQLESLFDLFPEDADEEEEQKGKVTD